ncbi:uncharacterized protein KGF55_001146 [Candida pseudojiufengensis]|uniref:uncharacterized protein n=1 Tax=Candida pseudojiufengensis TaxID=497109 RepID=UPI00222482E7|nr:uncharacterized protein KGF55_001146 [Candida pseudojiufengensis]KAI5965783.1 hypothetical protein KGF55_001146 [Candida pseudojiufengensis]
MQIFLKLPKELLSLIVSHIEDESIIKSLITIPGLQHIALNQIYPKFEINKKNKSIETLLGLFQEYKFVPSVIIGNVNQVNQLIDQPAFKLAKYEVEIAQGTRFSDFVSISEKASVVGLHLDQYLKPLVKVLENNEIRSFLDYVGNNDLLSLTISHLNKFKFQIPNSLKQLTISGGGIFELNLSDLQNLESFSCRDLRQTNTLESLQLTTSIKHLRLVYCDFKGLGNMIRYNKLKSLHIFCCPEIYDIATIEFPSSLKILDFVNNFQPDRIYELYEEKQPEYVIFSHKGLSILFYGLPPNLEVLRICDTMQTLALGATGILKSLNCLELCSIGEIDLTWVFRNLPNNMFQIIIEDCRIVNSEIPVLFPESKQIKFSNNQICFNPFKTNMNQLKSLELLDISDNNCRIGYCEYPIDPLTILSATEVNTKEKVCFKTPHLQNLILKLPDPLDDSDWESLSQASSDYSDGDCEFSPQVSFNCKNLTKIRMINLLISCLDLTEFPNSLEELIVKKSKVRTIHGKFSKFNKLKILDLQKNQITFKTLEHQKFPSSLVYMNLSNNEIEDLTCLKLENCVHLKDLILEKVTGKDEPEGAMQLKELFLNRDAPKASAILTNYDLKVIFRIVDGVIKKSTSKHKKRRNC